MSALTLTTKNCLTETGPAQRPGVSAPARSLHMLIVHLVQKPNAALQVTTIESAVGEFARSVTICINNCAGLFFVITTSLKGCFVLSCAMSLNRALTNSHVQT